MLRDELPSFDRLVLPHLGAAYNLARWLVRNDHDAEDVVQEATLRALRFFDGFSGENPRAWLLTVVRNSAYTFLTQNRTKAEETPAEAEPSAETPESLFLTSTQHRVLNEAVAALPAEFREVFVLREVEGLSYKEIAEAAAIPIGTVMSRLSRARRQLRSAVDRENEELVS
ncbi:MAG TPA: sigma-70 family RNA polymerase sigma factor [Myxococcales bacterium]|jgi:RNA polymerase sigma-70 factor (ECF subfamily)|nr:sigma-70 family RNA polymerase sigma factor [Myxococcales bacterium]